MNPYVYSRSKQLLEAAGQPQTMPSGKVPSLAALVKSAFTTNFSPATAFAMVLFAAGAVAGMSAIAYSEISNEGIAPLAHSVSHHQVLGVATYGYNQPVCGYNTANCLNYQLIGFNGSGWQVRIDYQLANNLTAAIKVNSWPFMDNLQGPGDGSGYTGYDLLPGKAYDFILYSKNGSRLKIITDLNIIAPERPEPVRPICPVQYNTLPQGCFLDYSTNRCGVVVCPTPPPYGYTVYTPTPAPGSWIEGWIDNISYGSSVTPGSVKISGWAEAQGSPLSVSMTLRNRDSGVEYAPTSSGFTETRSDVVSYLARASGSPNPNAYYNERNSFYVKFDGLPAGYYYIYNARYNGNLFNIHNVAQQPIYISPIPPCYGYNCNNPIVISTNDSTSATQGQYYKATFIASGGVGAPYNITTSQDSVDGLKFTPTYCGPGYSCNQVVSSNSITLYGTPLSGGNFPFTIKASDNAGNVNYVTFNLNVSAVPNQSYIKISNHSAGENFAVGATINIAWNNSPDVQSVSLYYDGPTACGSGTNSGCSTKINTIVENIANAGSYNWVIPNNPGQYYLRVVNALNQQGTSVLPLQFNILAPPPPPSGQVGPTGYTFCANENQNCSFTGSKSVAYGANGQFNYLTLSGGTLCANSVFGDPNYGNVKACFVKDIASGLTASLNSSVGSITVAPNQISQLVSSFLLTNSSAVDTLTINSITIQTATANVMGKFQNLKLIVNGLQFGNTQANLANNSSYSFGSGNSVKIPAGGVLRYLACTRTPWLKLT